MPIFQPNDYFWQNHWKEGTEQKWEAYAKVVRRIIADQGNFQLLDMRMEDKLAYKKTHFTKIRKGKGRKDGEEKVDKK